MLHAFEHVAPGDLGQVEPGGEIRAGGVQQHGARVGGGRREPAVEFGDGVVVERVALVRAMPTISTGPSRSLLSVPAPVMRSSLPLTIVFHN